MPKFDAGFHWRILLIPVLAFSSTIEVGGTYYGQTIWSSDTVLVNDDVLIPAGARVQILAGTMVLFQGPYQISVRGGLKALGAQENSIVFKPIDSTDSVNHWQGINCRDSGDESDSVTLEWCDFLFVRGNPNNIGGALSLTGEINAIVRNCTFQHCVAAQGGAVYLMGGKPILESNVFSDCRSSFGGAGYFSLSDVLFRDNKVYDNIAGSGGALYISGGSPRIIGNTIWGNTASASGGGIYISGNSNPTIASNIFWKNVAAEGGGLSFRTTINLLFLNNTVVNNFSKVGAGILLRSGSLSVVNSILWGNAGGTDAAQITIGSGATAVSLRSCCVQGGMSGIAYDHESQLPPDSILNLYEVYPAFFDSVAGDFRLPASSLCVDRGSTSYALSILHHDNDALGNPRIFNNAIDIGAVEIQTVGIMNGTRYVRPYLALPLFQGTFDLSGRKFKAPAQKVSQHWRLTLCNRAAKVE